MLTRSYGDVYGRFKDGTSIMLMPGEKPRTPYRYEDVTDRCPHCGARTGYVHTASYFGCRYCGTHLYAEIIPEMPMPLDCVREVEFVQAGGNPLVDAVCEKCGAEYRTVARKPARLCNRCRQAGYRRKHREKIRNPIQAPTPSQGESITKEDQ